MRCDCNALIVKNTHLYVTLAYLAILFRMWTRVLFQFNSIRNRAAAVKSASIIPYHYKQSSRCDHREREFPFGNSDNWMIVRLFMDISDFVLREVRVPFSADRFVIPYFPVLIVPFTTSFLRSSDARYCHQDTAIVKRDCH